VVRAIWLLQPLLNPKVVGSNPTRPIAGCSVSAVRLRVVEPGGYTPWVIFAVFVLIIVVAQAVR